MRVPLVLAASLLSVAALAADHDSQGAVVIPPAGQFSAHEDAKIDPATSHPNRARDQHQNIMHQQGDQK